MEFVVRDKAETKALVNLQLLVGKLATVDNITEGLDLRLVLLAFLG